MTFEKLMEDKHSTRMELADRMVDELVAAARGRGGARLLKAADTLAEWDRSADQESRGAVLFTEFIRRWSQPGNRFFATSWSATSPRDTPKGLADPARAAALLDEAAAEVEKRFGSIEVPWGEVNRLRIGETDLPGNGATGDPLGIFRVIDYVPANDGKFQAAGGDSYIAAIEFSKPIRAMALIGYGNSSQPGSKHQADQLSFVSGKRLRPVWRVRREVEAHLEERKRF